MSHTDSQLRLSRLNLFLMDFRDAEVCSLYPQKEPAVKEKNSCEARASGIQHIPSGCLLSPIS